MLAEAMPTDLEWMAILTVWFAWLWLPIVFLAFVLWRKRVAPALGWSFFILEGAAIGIWVNAYFR